MFDETRHTDEGLAAHRRGAHRLAIGEVVTGVCAKQDAVGIVQREERTDRQFFCGESSVEGRIAIQLALCGQLCDLATDSTFGAHIAAVERLQRLAVARNGHETTAEASRALPALRLCAVQAEADPTELQAREAESCIALQCSSGTLRGCTQLEGVGANRSRVVQHLLQQRLARCSGHVRRPLHAQIACRLSLRQRRAGAHRATMHLRCTDRACFEVPPQALQQALCTVQRRGCRAQRGQQQGHTHPSAAHVQSWSVLAGAGSGVVATGGTGLPASAGRYCCRRWKKRR